jgi:GT2 family glycosyltransferase
VHWRAPDARPALPTTSIVVPCHDGVAYTRACLASVLETLPRSFRGEIVVADDASEDGTETFLSELAATDARVRVVRGSTNVGFVASCNRAAGEATGEFLVFLNNDTVVQQGWLRPLLRTFRDFDDAGAVGGKLVYPDGRLQEAGGIVFSDGSAAKIGYGDHDVAAPAYAFVRPVDYCSGALLAVRRELFLELGGFDERYAFGFYEDTDLCLAIRERGLRVYYQPESVVVHVEGGTAGTDLSRGPKRHQVLNQARFAEKWATALERQPHRQ